MADMTTEISSFLSGASENFKNILGLTLSATQGFAQGAGSVFSNKAMMGGFIGALAISHLPSLMETAPEAPKTELLVQYDEKEGYVGTAAAAYFREKSSYETNKVLFDEISWQSDNLLNLTAALIDLYDEVESYADMTDGKISLKDQVKLISGVIDERSREIVAANIAAAEADKQTNPEKSGGYDTWQSIKRDVRLTRVDPGAPMQLNGFEGYTGNDQASNERFMVKDYRESFAKYAAENERMSDGIMKKTIMKSTLEKRNDDMMQTINTFVDYTKAEDFDASIAMDLLYVYAQTANSTADEFETELFSNGVIKDIIDTLDASDEEFAVAPTSP